MKIKIEKEGEQYILTRINAYNHATKRFCETKEELIELLETYPNLHDYEFEVDQPLWNVILKAIEKV